MKSFKQFIIENENRLTHRPRRGSGNIFTRSAGYRQNPPEQYNPSGSMMVHMTSHFPLDGRVETLGSHTLVPRETTHFTRNGAVSDHYAGNWSSSKYGIMVPEHKISDRLVNHGSHDSFTMGNVTLPSGSKVVLNWNGLEDHEKNHIAALTGSRSHQEARRRLRKGHTVNFGDNSVTLHSTRKKEDLRGAINRHLSASNITPVNIGNNYAIGFAGSDNRSWGEETRRRERFDSVYGPQGFIDRHYTSRRITTPNEKHQDTRIGRLERQVRSFHSGDHADSIFSEIEGHTSWRMAFHPDASEEHGFQLKQWQREAGRSEADEQKGKDTVHVLGKVISNPEQFHPTAFSSEESQAALRRLHTKVGQAYSGVSPNNIGPTLKAGKENRRNNMIAATTRILSGRRKSI